MAADNRDFVSSFANEGGGDVLVEDKRLEELKSATPKTGSQISTIAQYIPLQDTDGNIVKINPESFQEAVRNVLGSLLANNDKGATISGIPALSGSGGSLDFGSITPANLASVLGACYKNITISSRGTYSLNIPFQRALIMYQSSTSSNPKSFGEIITGMGNEYRVINQPEGGHNVLDLTYNYPTLVIGNDNEASYTFDFLIIKI